MEIKVGIKNEIEKVVTEDLLASKVGSGPVNVFATPMMIAAMEEASANLAAPYLDEGKTTVGIENSTTHTAATPLGMKVKIISEVTEVSGNGKIISYKVTAFDEVEKIGEGTHKRAVVSKDRFHEKALSKLNK